MKCCTLYVRKSHHFPAAHHKGRGKLDNESLPFRKAKCTPLLLEAPYRRNTFQHSVSAPLLCTLPSKSKPRAAAGGMPFRKVCRFDKAHRRGSFSSPAVSNSDVVCTASHTSVRRKQFPCQNKHFSRRVATSRKSNSTGWHVQIRKGGRFLTRATSEDLVEAAPSVATTEDGASSVSPAFPREFKSRKSADAVSEGLFPERLLEFS
jgi:hypothetical protein